ASCLAAAVRHCVDLRAHPRRGHPRLARTVGPAGHGVEADTYAALHKLEGLRGEIRPGSQRKISTALGQFAKSVDVDELTARIKLTRTDVVTPLMFSARLLDGARHGRRTIVLRTRSEEHTSELQSRGQ